MAEPDGGLRVWPAPNAGGIGGLDFGAQRRIERLVLVVGVVGVCALCAKCGFPASRVSFLRAGPGILCLGLDEQTHGGDASRSSFAAGFLATGALAAETLALVGDGEIPLFGSISNPVCCYFCRPKKWRYDERNDRHFLSFGLRLENALVSYGRYLAMLFWPENLCAFYPHPGQWPLAKVLPAGLLVLGLSTLTFALRRERPYLLTGWFWFLGTLVPVIGLVQVGAQSMADRYSYFPSIGILIAVIWEMHRLTKGWLYQRAGLSVAGGAVILTCITLTRHQIGFWRNEITLWSRAVAVTENNYKAHNLLGSAFFAQGNLAAGIREFQESIRLNPSFAEPWCSLGYMFILHGNSDQAIACYQKALEAQPDLVVAHMSLGNILLLAGRVDEALFQLQEAIKQDPRLAAAEDSLGRAFSLKGRWDEAIASYQRELEIQPDSAAAWNSLGLVLSRAGRFDEALAAFQRAVAIRPGDGSARNNLGYILLRTHRVDEAIHQFHAALQYQPDNAEGHNNLGSALAAKGQVDEAIPEFQEALRLKPNYADASHNLASALQVKGKLASPPTNSITP